ncbi:MAG: hypothetical protein AABW67_03800 [Nanoarchaeota archaeon]
MIKLENFIRGLPADIKHYPSHIGGVIGDQDYNNKKFILDGMCLGSKGIGCRVLAVRALDYINKYRGK